ncbi:MAG: pitrilysin family protein [Patescibacteria group bacterium]
MPQRALLKDGLRFVSKKLTSTQSVTVLVLVGAGSRYETRQNNGISHFLEHMFFKGAKKYTNAKEVSEAIDSVGGDFNAFTGKEYVGYYVKVASRHQDVALDVISDMLLHSKFDPEEIEKERGVIMEELNMYQDTPMYQVGWDFERLVYGDQPMGWDQIGTKDLIHTVTRQDFKDFQNSLYAPSNTIVAIAGDVDHDKTAKEVERLFDFSTKKHTGIHAPLEENKSSDRVHLGKKKTEQTHVVVGFPAYHEEHQDHYVEKVLSVVLGGGMSSRMFLAVREAKGLAYYIQSATDDYVDSGIISTRAGVDVKRVRDAITAIVEEYKRIRGEKIPEKELTKAKEYIKGKLVLKLEDSEEYAHLIGKNELLYGKLKSLADIQVAVDQVTVADIARVSADLFDPNKLYAAIIGPYDDSEKGEFEKLLTF